MAGSSEVGGRHESVVSGANDNAIDHSVIMPDHRGLLLPRRYRNARGHETLTHGEVCVVDLRPEIGVEVSPPASAVGTIGRYVLVEPLQHLGINRNVDCRADAGDRLLTGSPNEVDEVHLHDAFGTRVCYRLMDSQHPLLPLIEGDEDVIGAECLMHE